ncbi:MAG TPA: serine hydrolase domain-containing protein, partial [Thermoguttaceae bacterium]|nr:serine hydrolase domain-containing protein [Thermoguttaceae bacterium]
MLDLMLFFPHIEPAQTTPFRGPPVRVSILLLIAVLARAASAAEAPDLPTTGPAVPELAAFDRTMCDLLEKWGIPGGALAVAKDGRLLLARGYGLADVEAQQPVQPDALFRIASVSKPITAAAVLVLVEQGR